MLQGIWSNECQSLDGGKERRIKSGVHRQRRQGAGVEERAVCQERPMRQHCQRSVSSPTLYLGCIRLSSQQEVAKQGARLFTMVNWLSSQSQRLLSRAQRTSGLEIQIWRVRDRVAASGEKARNSFPKSRHVVLLDTSWALCFVFDHV